MDDLIRVDVANGKYTIIQAADGGLRALRHGEEWRNLAGDKMVLAMAQEIDELRAKLAATSR